MRSAGGIDDHAFADQADLGVAFDDALRDEAAGDGADPADLEGLADHRPAQVDHFFARLELAFQGRADVVGQVVDDVVLANLHALLVGQGAGPVVGHDVEADDHRVFRRGQGQPDVGSR